MKKTLALILLFALLSFAFAAFAEEADEIYTLAMAHYYGVGVKQDDQKAVALLEQAAELGQPDAMRKLGDCYRYSRGVDRSRELSELWYRKALACCEQAAQTGDANAMIKAGDVLRALSSYDYTLQDLKDQALAWYLKAAEAGSAEGMCLAGVWFEGRAFHSGDDAEKYYRAALEWYQEAAEAGSANALYRIGWLYENGYGAAQDNEQAMKYYILAAEAGDAAVCHHLGELYQMGYGFLAQDWRYAEKWYLKAAEAGNTSAMWRLGMMFGYGDSYDSGNPVDYEKAVYWLQKTIDREENPDIRSDAVTDLYYVTQSMNASQPDRSE